RVTVRGNSFITTRWPTHNTGTTRPSCGYAASPNVHHPTGLTRSVESNAANIATGEGIEGKEMDMNDRIKSLSPNAAFDILIATIVNQHGNGV
ncbi:hypothetical protein MTX35_25385, partial [Rhodococcus sp. ARC_M12]|uniref:hypothetical protein n=1 Tax=Rhodococcus sp. ARC_M12 TaxID=2928854 RepID=UPI001FB43F45